MTKLDAMIAPRALTAREVAEVLTPHLAAYGVAHRAFTFANLWDDPDAATGVVEVAQAAMAEDALRSVKDWLGDVQNDGEPRFYQSAGLTRVVNDLLSAAGQEFAALSADSSVSVAIEQLRDHDDDALDRIIARASR